MSLIFIVFRNHLSKDKIETPIIDKNNFENGHFYGYFYLNQKKDL